MRELLPGHIGIGYEARINHHHIAIRFGPVVGGGGAIGFLDLNRDLRLIDEQTEPGQVLGITFRLASSDSCIGWVRCGVAQS